MPKFKGILHKSKNKNNKRILKIILKVKIKA